MTHPDFVALVRSMRQAQSAYFKTKSGTILSQCKELERKIDKEIALFFEGPSLFDKEKR